MNLQSHNKEFCSKHARKSLEGFEQEYKNI